MKQFNVTGMSCAACSARVENAVKAVAGVSDCAVNLLTNSMGVEGEADAADIIAAVEAAGYGAALKGKGAAAKGSPYEDMLTDKETPVMRQRLIVSVCLLLPLMYVSMGHMMWGWPLPERLANNHPAMGLVQLLFTTAIMIVNQKFFINGFKGLLHKAPNMDTLIALGAMSSYVYSLYALFAMTEAQLMQDMEQVMHYMHEFYFESAAMILTLITVGKLLEAKSKGRTTDALKSLMKLAPGTAVVLRDGIEKEIDIEQVRIGDLFVVRPGEKIPVDGIVIEGSSAVNEAVLTGESIPVDKEPGAAVSAATLNQSGFLKCEAVRVGEDTALSQIIQMVSDASATKAPIAKIADRVSGVFVPVVITIAVITAAGWLLAGETAGFALARGVSVLVISCPCALGLATPVAIMAGSGMGAKQGIMFKTAAALEETGKAQVVALDKTGTITKGEPQVTDIVAAPGYTEAAFLELAYSLEHKSEHPLAKAVVRLGEKRDLRLSEVTDFIAVAGNGLTARIKGAAVCGGNLKFIEKYCSINAEMRERAVGFAENGKTPLFFACGGKLAGILAVADVIKEDSQQAIKELRNMGIRVIMLTGDNNKTAQAIGQQAGVDYVIAGVLPDEKEGVIRDLQQYGRITMVGDGINDAPALTRADIGIAIGAGTDIAIDAAEVVLMKSRLKDVPAAIRLSRRTLRSIHENLFWAFFYNVIGIPLAAGLFYPAFGWKLNPMFAAMAMSLSSVCVVTNALRLNLFKVYDSERDRKNRNLLPDNIFIKYQKEKEEKNSMKITVNGMMCPHCEAHVKKALEAIDGVEEAAASHSENLVTVTVSKAVDEELIKAAVTEAGYEYVGVI